ncbi:MAG: Flp pilus assembly complex ATPase component TadA, partial [Thermoguttaceae bacterium]|nr:Flp pilus assembly complex ATPase component TadA [Thermoguttaceae bacterium]
MRKIKVLSGSEDFLSKGIPDGDFIMTLGRHSECDVVLPGNGVSRRHAKLSARDGHFYVEDLNSTAGTILNGKKIDGATQFSAGDLIKIADYTISLTEVPDNITPAKEVPAKVVNEPTPDFKKEFADATVLYEPEIMALTRSIHEDILEKLNLSENALKDLNKADMRSKLEKCLDLTLKERRHEIPTKIPMTLFRQALLDELIGFGPLSPLLRSPKISEIMVNGPNVVFVESSGLLFNSGVRFFNEQHLLSIIQRIVEPLGRHVDDASPMVDARLPDGSRVNAVIPPLALRGASVTVRKFADKKLTTDDLISFGSMTREMALFLEEAVKAKKNILVSGGTGSGKTT